MKKIFVLLSLLLSFNLFAVEVTVNEGICIEVDPFVVGDTCVLFVTAPGASKIALVFDYDDFLNEFGINENELEGEKINVDFNLVKKIKSRKALKELRQMDKTYFYMYAPVKAVRL